MKPSNRIIGFARRTMLASALLLGAQFASAHVTYTGRDFGTFAGTGAEAPVTINGQTVSSAFGWADGTDDDFADSHRTRAFRFTLTHTAVVTFRVQGVTVGGSTPLVHPAFSIFQGICHVSPSVADHDGTQITLDYLNSLPGPSPKDGAFRSLTDWKVGNDPVYNTAGDPLSGEAIPATLSSLTYVGHKADGTSDNYGTAPGIDGDGVADGIVTATFTLPAGLYSIHVGGGDYAAIAPSPFPTFGITTTLTVTADVTAPVLSVPSNIVTTATDANGAAVDFDLSALDAGDGAVAVVTDYPSGTVFPIGTTTVHVSATDSSNNTATSSFTVTVDKSTDATLASLSLDGATLLPAFDPAVLTYTATFGNTTTATTVTASATHPAASFIQSPANPLTLPVGTTPMTLAVTAQDGTTTKTYTVNIKRTVVDKTAPSVRITAPGATVTNPFTLMGTVSEAIGLASVMVTFNGAVVFNGPLASETGTAIPFSVAGLVPENGLNSISIKATDYNGKTTTVSKTVTYLNTRPALAGNYVVLLNPVGTPNNDTAGLLNVTVTNTGTFSGKATISGTTIGFSGLLNNAGQARFKPSLGTATALLDRGEVFANLGYLGFSVGESGLMGSLSTQAIGGTILSHGSGAVSALAVSRSVYNIAFPAKTQSWTSDLSLYPQGSGYVMLTVTERAVVSAAGLLADGAKFSAASKLRADGTVPLFAMLYKKLGFASGELTLADLANSDATGADLLWFRPAISRSAYYPSGWTSLLFDATGTKYLKPASLNFGQGPANLVDGNAVVAYTKGLLGSSITKTVSIDPTTGAVKKAPATDTSFSLGLSVGTGIFSGAFTYEGATKTAFKGILLTKGAAGAGYGFFLSPPPSGYGESGQGGKVTLTPSATVD